MTDALWIRKKNKENKEESFIGAVIGNRSGTGDFGLWTLNRLQSTANIFGKRFLTDDTLY